MGSFGATSTAVVATGTDFSTGLYLFLDDLSPSTLGRLYEAPSSCLSIFRLLPQTARHIILNMLWFEHPVTRADLETVVRERRSEGTERRHLTTALNALARLHIITFVNRTSKQNGRNAEFHDQTSDEVFVSPRFRENLRTALTGGGSHGSFGVPSQTRDSNAVDVTFLDKHAETQWETILHYMVGSEFAGRPSDNVLKLLVQSGLMISTSAKGLGNLKITSEGFQFLLEDVNTQLWDLLLEYLRSSSDTVEVLSFLFMLGSLELGQDYSTETLSSTELNLLHDLCDYGLIYQKDPASTRYYPTRLATTLTSTAPPLVSATHASEEQGFLIIETNYKIYAYTSNPLQIAVLNLFVSLKSRFPNLVTGKITRDSIKKGLENGIKADQIISYLQSRAHPQMRKQQPVLPSTVVDQIRLWDMEGQRLDSVEGYIYDDFLSESDFDLVANYARELGVMMWELKARKKLCVSVEGHGQVREFIIRRTQAQAAVIAAMNQDE